MPHGSRAWADNSTTLSSQDPQRRLRPLVRSVTFESFRSPVAVPRNVVRLGLDMVILILNDSAYDMIRWKQEAMGFKDFGLTFKSPDFVQYARCYGAQGHRIERTTQLAPTIRLCFERGGFT